MAHSQYGGKPTSNHQPQPQPQYQPQNGNTSARTNNNLKMLMLLLLIYFISEIYNIIFSVLIIKNNICNKDKLYFYNDNYIFKQIYFYSNIFATIYSIFIYLSIFVNIKDNRNHKLLIFLCIVFMIVYSIISIYYITTIKNENNVECKGKTYFEYTDLKPNILYLIIIIKIMHLIILFIFINCSNGSNNTNTKQVQNTTTTTSWELYI